MTSSNADFLHPIAPTFGAAQCDPRVAFVFVHGAKGDHRETWTFPPMLPAKTFWPELVKGDTAVFGRVDVFSYDYVSTKFSTGSKPVAEVARSLRARMAENRLPDYERIVFVAHSLGCVVIRQFLVDDAADGGAYLAKARFVLSLAAAYLGSDLAKLVRLVGSRNQQLEEVSANSTFLAEVNREWGALARSRSPERGERPFVLSAWAEGDKVNSRESAEEGTDAFPPFPKVLKFDLNHRSDLFPHTGICRPSGEHHESHALLRRAYADLGLRPPR